MKNVTVILLFILSNIKITSAQEFELRANYFLQSNFVTNKKSELALEFDKNSTKVHSLKPLSIIYKTIELDEYSNPKSITYKYEIKYSLNGRSIEYKIQKLTENKWINIRRYNKTYDNDGLITLHEEEKWFENKWIADQKIITEYDIQRRKTNVVYQNMLRNSFQTYKEIIFEYSLNNYLISRIEKSFEDGVVTNGSIQKYSYDELNRLVSLTSYFRLDSTNGINQIYTYTSSGKRKTTLIREKYNSQWENSILFEYKYDDKDNEISITISDWIVDEWIYSHRNVAEFNSQNYKINEVAEGWYDEKWNLRERELYSYNNSGKVLKYIHQWYQDIGWVNNNRRVYEYDNSDNKILELVELWNNEKWEPQYKNSNQYNQEGNIVHSTSEKWENSWVPLISETSLKLPDSEINLFFDYYEFSVSYTTADDFRNQIPTNYFISQNYPNPFNPTTEFYISIPNDSIVELTVYNSIGEKITTLKNEFMTKGNYIIHFNASGLASGIYFYTLQTEDFIQTKKMILLK